MTFPSTPIYQPYINNRNFSQPACTLVDEGDCDNGVYNPVAGDLGPEAIDYFALGGKQYIVVVNEVSGTTAVYQRGFNNQEIIK